MNPPAGILKQEALSIGLTVIKLIEVKRIKEKITGVKTVIAKICKVRVSNTKVNIKKIPGITLKFKVLPNT